MQPLLVILFFNESPKIFLANTLQIDVYYIKLLRCSENLLFISLNKPYKAISWQTLSSWVKEGFFECGLDSVFSVHSARHASSSAARRSGVDLDIIWKTYDWPIEFQTFPKDGRKIVLNKRDYELAIWNN